MQRREILKAVGVAPVALVVPRAGGVAANDALPEGGHMDMDHRDAIAASLAFLHGVMNDVQETIDTRINAANSLAYHGLSVADRSMALGNNVVFKVKR